MFLCGKKQSWTSQLRFSELIYFPGKQTNVCIIGWDYFFRSLKKVSDLATMLGALPTKPADLHQLKALSTAWVSMRW